MRTSLRYGLLALALLIIGASIAIHTYVQNLGPQAKDRVVQALQDRFDADIDLKSFHLTVFPHPELVAEQLSIRHKGWNDPHPVVFMRRLTAIAGFSTLLGRANDVSFVRIEGLVIHLPPRGRSTVQPVARNQPELVSAESGHDSTRFRFLIQTIVADGALLQLEPKIHGKQPLRFDIQKLTLHSVGPGQPMAFKASLTNAKPPGLIDSTGEFGPWQRDDPRSTPVSGNYTFQNADLSVFKGIAGILSSDGSYHGVLQRIEVDGTTDMPKFSLKRGAEAVHLVTSFHSTVNGIDGDTLLDNVDARFLRSEFICKGGIIQKPGASGKTVSLDAVSKRGRIEDILRLVLGNKKPFLTGAVNFQTRIDIPPGPKDVLDKLTLNGQFGLLSAEFTSLELAQRLNTLSERARGIPKVHEAESPRTVASDFLGRFRLAGGTASFSRLSFSVPGALMSLTGTYGLRSEQIDMQGTFRMQATLSQTQSGIKHWLLKPFDRFFEKQGAGFQLPIRITGTRDHPEFGVILFHREMILH